MQTDAIPANSYVIKALDVSALNYLEPDSPRPSRVEWINRGTDRTLRPTSVQQLLRTYHRENISSSVRRLQEAAGLKAIFASSEERCTFAGRFNRALAVEKEQRQHIVSAVFASRAEARRATACLLEVGIPPDAVCSMEEASQVAGRDLRLPKGHGKLNVAGATASGGLLGAMLGVAILSIPGVGAVAVTGALAASALSSVAAVSGIIGATGGAMAKMVSDFDVDGLALGHLVDQIRRGSVVVSIDARICETRQTEIQQLLIALGGKLPWHG